MAESGFDLPGKTGGVAYQEFHGAWLLLEILAKHFDQACTGTPCTWTPDLQGLLDYVVPLLEKASGLRAKDLFEDVGVDGVAWHVCAMVAEDLGVDMDSHVLAVDLGTCIPGAAPPALALEYVVIWSEVLLPHLGTVMLRTLQVQCLENSVHHARTAPGHWPTRAKNSSMS